MDAQEDAQTKTHKPTNALTVVDLFSLDAFFQMIENVQKLIEEGRECEVEAGRKTLLPPKDFPTHNVGLQILQKTGTGMHQIAHFLRKVHI